VTDFAAAAIWHLLEGCNAPYNAGLRIAKAPTGGRPKAGLAAAPAPDDTVVVAVDGARVFLDAAATALLDGKFLYVTLGEGGCIEFCTAHAAQPIESGR
jgi:iron-sulfur cluster assembly protein